MSCGRVDTHSSADRARSRAEATRPVRSHYEGHGPLAHGDVRVRWPWVSRELYEQIEAAWLHTRDDCWNLQTRYDALLEKYHALKVQGAVPEKQSEPVIAKEPSPLDYAIAEKAGSNHRLRLYLTGYAAREKASNVDEATIISRISNWNADESDD